MSERIKDILVSILFIIIIFGLSLANIIVKDTEVSESERRKLKQFPKFTLENITSGNYIDEMENYIMDQFVLRDDIRSIKTFVKLNVFYQKENNNFFKMDNQIYKTEFPFNEKSVLNIANKINQIYFNFLDDSNAVYYTVVPDKNYFLSEKEYLKLDYNKLNTLLRDNINVNIKYIDIYDTLSKESYYNTDAHWSQEKLLNTSKRISEEMGFYNRINTEFLIKEYKKFYGTYYGQLADKSLTEDIIKYCDNEILENAKVYNYETNKESSIYDMEKFETSMDKYEFFLSGSVPLLKITNEKTKDNTLIVFRDSFGSSIVPLFTEAYNTIYLVDTRYIAPQLLTDYIEFKNADVLFMYSTLVINQSGSLK